MIRLFHENKLLKTKQNDLNEERLLLINSQYEDAKERNKELQVKLNELTKLNIELECQINDLKKKDALNLNEASELVKITQNAQINSQEALALFGHSSQIKPSEDLINDLKSKLSRIQDNFDEECKKNEQTIRKLEQTIENLSKENQRKI
jgi:hypothetical protein